MPLKRCMETMPLHAPFQPFDVRFTPRDEMSWFDGTVLCRYIRTAAKDFWLAAPRATGALEVMMVVPKVSPAALRSNHCIFTVSLPTRVGRPR